MDENLDRTETGELFFGSLGEWMLDLFADEGSGLSLMESLLLDQVGRKKFIKMSDLAELLHLPPTTATSMVDRLAAQGLVKRSRFEDERRIVAVSLSPEGQELWEKQLARRSVLMKERLRGLPEEERREFQALLVKIG